MVNVGEYIKIFLERHVNDIRHALKPVRINFVVGGAGIEMVGVRDYTIVSGVFFKLTWATWTCQEAGCS